MANITAHFGADFSDFLSAVDAADVKLKDFQTDAGKVATSINRIADSFSGRKIIQDAELATKAIGGIEGVTSLTAKEQQRLNALLTEAIAKYEALGAQAPAEMQAIADATKSIPKSTTDATSKLEELQRLAATAFAIDRVVAFGRSVMELGDQLVTTADRTGMTIDEVQRLDYIASQSNTTIDDFTGAIGQLQNRLAGGDKSAVGALSQLGLSFQDLASVDAYGQLTKIADGLERIPNQATRVQVAMDLFGKSGASLLPALQSDFKKTGDAATVMADDTARALGHMNDDLEAAKRRIQIWAADAVELFSHVGDGFVIGLYPALAKVEDLVAKTFDKLAKIPGSSKLFDFTGAAAESRANAQWYRDAVAAQVQQLDALAVAADNARTRGVAPLVQVDKDAAAAAKKHADEIANLIDKLSGRESITAAKDIVEAMAQVGDAAKLSADAQGQIFKTVDAAIDAYRRLGLVAPQAMRDLWIATQNVIPVTNGITQGIGDIGTKASIEIPKTIQYFDALKAKQAEVFGGGATAQLDAFGAKWADVDAQIAANEAARAAALKENQAQVGATQEQMAEGAAVINNTYDRLFQDIIAKANQGGTAVAGAVGDPKIAGAAASSAANIQNSFNTVFGNITFAAQQMASSVAGALKAAQMDEAYRAAGFTVDSTSPAFMLQSRALGTRTTANLPAIGSVPVEWARGASSQAVPWGVGGGGNTNTMNVNVTSGIGGSAAMVGSDVADAIIAAMRARGIKF